MKKMRFTLTKLIVKQLAVVAVELTKWKLEQPGATSAESVL
jgi:hypothetical protein